MNYNFCTLFNQKYLLRGLAMRESILKYCPNSTVFIFAFDQLTYEILNKLNLENTEIIELDKLEKKYNELLQAKNNRSFKEYFWTSTPFVIDYVLSCFDVDKITYVDADCYFFNSPAILIDSIPDSKTVSISPHNYSDEYQKFDSTSGKYCVEFLTFKNCQDAKKVLNWWKDSCIIWCYDRFEDGKFGDQKYLENFKNISDNVFDLEHRGQGIAPWNCSMYEFISDQKKIKFKEKNKPNDYFDLIYYHFHNLKPTEVNIAWQDGGYYFAKKLVILVYIPYIKKLKKIFESLNINEPLDYEKKEDNGFIKNIVKKIKFWFKYIFTENKINKFQI